MIFLIKSTWCGPQDARKHVSCCPKHSLQSEQWMLWIITLQCNSNWIDTVKYWNLPDIGPRRPDADCKISEDMSDAVKNIYDSLNNEFDWILHCKCNPNWINTAEYPNLPNIGPRRPEGDCVRGLPSFWPFEPYPTSDWSDSNIG
jgi:hypothetical protein